MIPYLNGIGRDGINGFEGGDESSSGEWGEPKSKWGICGGGWFVEFNCGKGPPSNFNPGPDILLGPEWCSGGVTTRVGPAGGSVGENSLTAILMLYCSIRWTCYRPCFGDGKNVLR